MKQFLILIFLFSLNASADWVKLSDFDTCGVTGYYDKHTCENEQSSECAKRPQGYESDCGIFNIANATIDDLEKPIWGTRSMVEQCADTETCQLIHANKECVDERQSFWSEDDLEVWCNKITGYEQKFSHKIAVIDQARFNQREAGRLAQKQREEEIALGEIIKARAQKAIAKVTAYNHTSGFTIEQIDGIEVEFANIYDALSKNRIDKAMMLLEATTPTPLVSQQLIDDIKAILRGEQ